MGKNKGSQKNQKNKSVFKVATTRSVKLKAKAQKVMTNLKKLDLKKDKSAKNDKTTRIDQQLQELRKEVHQSKPKAKVNPGKQENTVTKKNRNVARVQTDATTSLVKKMQI